MALWDTNTGLGNLFGGMNIWGTKIPDYLKGVPATGTTAAIPGLLSDKQLEDLKTQSAVQGGLGFLASYLAQPKNQGYGSALPYLGKAWMMGSEASKGAVNEAMQNMKTVQELKKYNLQQQAMSNILNDPRVKNDPVLFGLAQAGEYDKVASALTPTSDMKNYEAARKAGFKGTFLQYQQVVDPYKAATYQWMTGETLPGYGGSVPGTPPRTNTPIKGQGGMAMFSVVDPTGVEHKFATQAQADDFKRRAGITN